MLGTGCHCLEDFSAHSNYTELALIELGERDVFPHVGRDTQIELEGARHPVYPIVTGTFGGVDFLMSVMGEFSDKATQSELQELEGTIQQSQNADTSLLKELLDKLPPGILGDSDHKGKADQLQANAQAAHMDNLTISPKEPEEVTRQINEISKQIYPILEFHDNIVKSISEAIEKIPVLPDLIEEVQNQVSLFVFSLLAPFILPVISQVKEELRTGSSEIIQSSNDKQHVVFHDDESTDPTHSMLSKDHFSNILNEPAGKVASQVLKWVVPQIVACWDDDDIDIRRTNDRIINGVFHHPALRDYGDDGAVDGRRAMFEVVERWWGELDESAKDEMRDQLSRNGVEEGRNQKPGVHDSGHGCGKPLGLPTMKTSQSSGAIGGVMGALSGGSSGGGRQSQVQGKISDTVGEAVGGGALGSIVGGLAGAVGGGILGGAFGGDKSDTKTYESQQYGEDGSYSSRITETGHRPGGHGQQERYGQAQVSETQYASGGYREDYQRYEQDGSQGRTGYGFEQSQEVRPTYGGGYEQRTERRYEHPGGRFEAEVQEQHVSSSGRQYGHEESYSGHRKKDDSDDDDSDDDDDWEKKEKKRRKKEEKRLKKMREEQEGYGRRKSKSRSRSRSRERRGSNEYKRQSGGYRRGEYEERSSYGRQEYSESRYEESSYGGGRSGYEQQSSYGGSRSEYGQQPSYPGEGDSFAGGGYGQPRQEYGSSGYGGESYGRPAREEYGGGSGYGGGDEYGERRRDDEMSGGFGGSSGYGGRYGGGSGYGEGGYEQRRW